MLTPATPATLVQYNYLLLLLNSRHIFLTEKQKALATETAADVWATTTFDQANVLIAKYQVLITSRQSTKLPPVNAAHPIPQNTLKPVQSAPAAIVATATRTQPLHQVATITVNNKPIVVEAQNHEHAKRLLTEAVNEYAATMGLDSNSFILDFNE